VQDEIQQVKVEAGLKEISGNLSQTPQNFLKAVKKIGLF
jgi:hypothetical protein